MGEKFQMNDLGKLSYYLGIEVEQSDGCIVLKQSGYARKDSRESRYAGMQPYNLSYGPKGVAYK